MEKLAVTNFTWGTPRRGFFHVYPMDKPNKQQKMDSIKALPSSNQLKWPIWRTLICTRTEVGRTKDNLKKFGQIEGTPTTSKRGIEQTVNYYYAIPELFVFLYTR